MSRLRKPGWKPCDEFKSREKKVTSTGSDEVHFAKSLDSTKIGSSSEEPRAQKKRIKTLARAAKSEVPKVRADLKSRLPTLTAVEVRRHRIPYHESVLLELEEEGFRDAAEYLAMLFELDEETRLKAGPGSVVWKKPRLRDRKGFLERLRSGLTTAEIAKRSGKLMTQAASLLDLALFFESTTWEWFWIAEQLFRSSLKIAENVEYDEDQTLNVIRYLYGRFLFNQMDEPQEALNYLEEARVASEGKRWNASKVLGVKQETLYRESCVVLHKALLTVADRVETEDPEMSVRAAIHALKRATDSVHDEHIAAALYKLGKSQLSRDEVKLALVTLSKFLAIARRIPDPEGVCDAHLQLAFAHKELEDSEGTVRHLTLLRECADQYELPYKLAQAHYYTGEYLLNKNQANLATPHLELAFRRFTILGKAEEANRARCAAGVSKGHEVMERYVDLVLDCEAGVTDATTKMCLWKNRRIPFWSSSDALTAGDSSQNHSQASASTSLSKTALTTTSRGDEGETVTQDVRLQ